MRHRKKFNHLGRKAQHRKAMLSNMAASLILKKRIFTTTAKAKALRIYVEPLITKSKEDSTHSRRTVFSYLQDKNAVSELFREVSQKIATRPGGYTRILKTGFRKGDGAEMCFIELVDYNTNMLKTTEETTKRTRRSRRGRKSSPAAAANTSESKTQDQQKPDIAEDEQKTIDQGAENVDLNDQKTDPQSTSEVEETKSETPEDVDASGDEKEDKKTDADAQAEDDKK